MELFKDDCWKLLNESNCDAVSIAIVDFTRQNFQTIQMSKRAGEIIEDSRAIFYDLASVSKPLTLSLGYFLNPEIVSADMLLLLNHRAGLPAWGLLPKHGWQEIIKSYPIKESETLYSDFSALRFMLEYNERSPQKIHDVCKKIWDQEVYFWKELPADSFCLQCGYVNGRPNVGIVHDPNARVIDDYVGHAGLFGTVGGVAQTLLNFNNNLKFISKISASIKQAKKKTRFHFGWDTVDLEGNSLAGKGCSELTFGHLGFTGTSIWIDPKRMIGVVFLTNAVKHYWYDKDVLNFYRRKIGAKIWSVYQEQNS